MNTDITIPAAYYDECFAAGMSVPQEQEIRAKGKGKQYIVLRDALASSAMIQSAIEDFQNESNPAALNFLRAIRKQGFSLLIDLPEPTAKAVTRKTNAIGDRRNLIVTITPEGDLILRPAGRRKSVSISLSAVYSLAVNAEARKAIALAKAKRKERKAERRAERDAAVMAFKANPTQITLR
jgi:regulator of protease activity HflC (stomatin/prohibitin superfamily)